MKEKRLKQILEKHSPNAKAQPVLLLNKKVNESMKALGKARRSRGKAREKEERIRKELETIYDNLQYVAEPAIVFPMETCILLNQIRWGIFDLGISLRMFKEKKNQDFYFDLDNSLDKLFSRIPAQHSLRAKKISNHLRILKFLPCLESEISHQESLTDGVKFKWTVLGLGLIFTVLIAIGINSFQVIIPGIFLSIAAYILVSFLSKGNKEEEEIPGGFNVRYRYLSQRSRKALKDNCMQTLEQIVHENRWRYPTTLSQAQKLKPRCISKIMALADPATKVGAASPPQEAALALPE